MAIPSRDRPVCGKCRQEMTPENSRLRPELFYCDTCLPNELRPKVPQVMEPTGAGAGMAYREVAKSAYVAYGFVTGKLNFAGAKMPDWEDLPIRIRLAWEAAVRQANHCYTSGGMGSMGGYMGEERWERWGAERINSVL